MSYRRYGGLHLNPIWVLIGVNTVILIAVYVNQDLIYMRFGLIPLLFTQQPWTIVTYMFVHANYWHLITNMITLYFFGSYVMALVGETSFLTTYFAGGLMGGLFFLLLAPTPMAVVVGASGAIFALGGTLAVMRPNVKVYTFPLPIAMPLWVAVAGGFMIVLVPYLGSGIAWQAHLGGLLYGLAIGYYFRRRERRW
jgi:uncharacterized protein